MNYGLKEKILVYIKYAIFIGYIKNNNFSNRYKAHERQPLPNSCIYTINSFLIGNMDQTPVFFNMTENRTVSFKGIKTVSIKTQNQDKSRCSVFLTITAYVDKLPQLTNKNVINGRYFLWCNNNT